MQITRTTNPNGTYRYTIDGEVYMKASKVFYSDVTVYAVQGDDTAAPVLFHKSPQAASRASGYKGWTKVASAAIIDGDPMPAADELTWHEKPGQSKAFAPQGGCVIEIGVDGRGLWCWAVVRRGPVAHGVGVVDLATAKADALAALAAF